MSVGRGEAQFVNGLCTFVPWGPGTVRAQIPTFGGESTAQTWEAEVQTNFTLSGKSYYSLWCSFWKH